MIQGVDEWTDNRWDDVASKGEDILGEEESNETPREDGGEDTSEEPDVAVDAFVQFPKLRMKKSIRVESNVIHKNSQFNTG